MYEIPCSVDRDTTDEQLVLVDAAVGAGVYAGEDVAVDGVLVVVELPPASEHFM